MPRPASAGCVPGIVAPDWFIGQQMAQHTSVPSSKNSQLVAQQLGNAFGLLAMVGAAVLYTTNEPKVVRNYLVALWIADIGHVYLTYRGLGSDRFMDVASWNAMTWGNVFVTVRSSPSFSSLHSLSDSSGIKCSYDTD